MSKPPKKPVSKDDPAHPDFVFGAVADGDNEPPDEVKVLPAGEDLSGELSEAEKEKLIAEARREVARDLKLSKMKEFKAQQKKKIMAQAMFAEGKDDTGVDLVEVYMDIASYPKWIMINGRRFHHGRTYRVKQGVAAVLMEQMDRGWRQEEARRGEKVEYERRTERTLRAKGLVETVLH